MERREEGHSQASVCKRVQNAVRGSRSKDTHENPYQIATMNLILEQARNRQCHYTSKKERVRESAVSEQIIVGNPKWKPEYIRIRQHRADCCDPCHFASNFAWSKHLRDCCASQRMG